MKIAVTAQGRDLASSVDPNFGRAGRFLVVDTETGAFEAVDNTQSANAAQGAGIQSAQNLSRLGVAAVLTGNCGPNAFRALSAAGIKVYTGISGTVAQAVEDFKAGRLAPADAANVEGRWGMK